MTHFVGCWFIGRLYCFQERQGSLDGGTSHGHLGGDSVGVFSELVCCVFGVVLGLKIALLFIVGLAVPVQLFTEREWGVDENPR